MAAAQVDKDQKRTYTLASAAANLDISVRALQRIIAAGDILPRYHNRTPLIPASELDAWVERLPLEPKGS